MVERESSRRLEGMAVEDFDGEEVRIGRNMEQAPEGPESGRVPLMVQ